MGSFAVTDLPLEKKDGLYIERVSSFFDTVFSLNKKYSLVFFFF